MVLTMQEKRTLPTSVIHDQSQGCHWVYVASELDLFVSHWL